MAGGVVGGFLASASSLTTVSSAALLGGVGGPLIQTLLDKHQRLRELKENQLYFYYATGEALGGGRRVTGIEWVSKRASNRTHKAPSQGAYRLLPRVAHQAPERANAW